MSSKMFRLGLFIISGFLICMIGGYFALSSPHLAEEGSEVTPAQFTKMRERWASEGPDHYRLVGGYRYEIVGGCSEDVEVWDEKVIGVFRSDCDRSGVLTVSSFFDMFQDFVGSGSARPLASDGCRYYYVTAIFDRETGYPLYMKSHIVSASTRRLYFSLKETFSVQSCLAIGPPVLTATIESVTPLK